MHMLLIGHDCSTAQQRGWGGSTNGDLLHLAQDEFELFITSDQNIRYQQNLAGRRISVLELSTNKLRRFKRPPPRFNRRSPLSSQANFATCRFLDGATTRRVTLRGPA